MISEANEADLEALGIDAATLEAEQDATGLMDEDNLSYMEEPDMQDGVQAQRAANDSESEATNRAMFMEDLTPMENEDADPVGDQESVAGDQEED
jgi:hypothetical protein